MRHILALISCVALFYTMAAQSRVSNWNVFKRLRCPATPYPENPLLVVDGIVNEEFDLKKIDPNNIQSIDILNNPAAQTIYGSLAWRGAVIITTKTAKRKTIYVKDFITGEAIPAADIELFSMNENVEPIHLISDSSGKVVSNKIHGEDYELSVTSTGYKSFRSVISLKQIDSVYIVNLVSEYKTLGEVVVRANKSITSPIDQKLRPSTYDLWRWRLLVCKIPGVRIEMLPEENDIEHKFIDLKIYPNPAGRSGKINIEFKSEKEEVLKMKIFGVDGKGIITREYKAIKGINRFEYRFDSKLASGVYAIQIIDRSNKPVKSGKLVIQ